MQATVAQTILKALSAWGVQNIFGVSGNAILPLLDALGKQDQIKFYGTISEQGAAFAAGGEARVTGKIGVCLATEGPGALNLANGVADAFRDEVPLLVLTGQVKSDQINTNAKQYLNLQQVFAPITGWSTQLTRPESLLPTLQAALEKAIGDSVPCHISIPEDIFQAPVSPPPEIPGLAPPGPPKIKGNIDDFCQIINQGQKPVMITGKMAIPYQEKVLALAQKIGAGIIPGQGARGIYPGALHQNLGGLGGAHIPPLLSEADTVFLIGASSYEYQFIPHSAQVSILQIESKPQNLAQIPGLWSLTGDFSLILNILQQKIVEKNNAGWREKVDQCQLDFIKMIQAEIAIPDRPISPRAVIAAINETVTPDAVIALDTGEFMHWWDRGFIAQKQNVLVSENWRCIGGGLPTGLGAKAACPERQTVVLAGDGGVMLNMPEICTAVKYNLPLVIIIFNNGCFLLEKHRMQKKNMHPYGVELAQPDFVGWARSCGAEGMRVENPADLLPALRQAMSMDKTTVIDIITGQEKPMYM